MLHIVHMIERRSGACAPRVILVVVALAGLVLAAGLALATR